MNKRTITIIDGLREHPEKGMLTQNNHMESILQRLYEKNYDWKYYGNKTLKDSEGNSVKTESGHAVKPDFISEKFRLIIEIDGAGGHNHGHFSSARQCIVDREKDELYKKLGYKVIRIPMYVQLDSEMVEYYFGIKYEQDLYESCHDHGFSHDQILLPADFCQLGKDRFRREFQRLPKKVKNVIIQSLKDRIIRFQVEEHYSYDIAKRIVIPPDLDDIIFV